MHLAQETIQSQKAIAHGKELMIAAHEQWQAAERHGIRPMFVNPQSKWELAVTPVAAMEPLDPTAWLAQTSLIGGSKSPLFMTAFLKKSTPPQDFELGGDHFLDLLPEIQNNFLNCQPTDFSPLENSYSVKTMAGQYKTLADGLRMVSNHEIFDGTTYSFAIGKQLVAAIKGYTAYDKETIDLTIHDAGKTLRQREGEVIVQCSGILRPDTATTSVMTTEQYSFPNSPFPEGKRYLSEDQQTYLVNHVASQLLNGEIAPHITPSGHHFTTNDHRISSGTTFEVAEALQLYVPQSVNYEF